MNNDKSDWPITRSRLLLKKRARWDSVSFVLSTESINVVLCRFSSTWYSLSRPVLDGRGLHRWGGGGPFAIWVQRGVGHPRPNRGCSAIRGARWTHRGTLMGHPGPWGHTWTLWGQKVRQKTSPRERERELSMYICMYVIWIFIWNCWMIVWIFRSPMHACYNKIPDVSIDTAQWGLCSHVLPYQALI